MTRDDMTKAQLLDALKLQDQEVERHQELEKTNRDLMRHQDLALANKLNEIANLKHRLHVSETMGLALAKTIT